MAVVLVVVIRLHTSTVLRFIAATFEPIFAFWNRSATGLVEKAQILVQIFTIFLVVKRRQRHV